MARYSLFVLKVLLNPKQTNKQTNSRMELNQVTVDHRLYVATLAPIRRGQVPFV